MTARMLYRSYRFFYAARMWSARHFTPAGTLVIWAMVMSTILGINTYKTGIYQLTVFLAAVIGISVLASLLPYKVNVNIRRILPEYAGIDQPFTYQIEITNLSDKIEKGVVLYENIHDPRPSLHTLQTQREPHENKRNIWDRKTLYYRWTWLINKNSKVVLSPVQVPDLQPGKTVRITVERTPRYRGYINFSGITLARCDPLGLFNRLFAIKKSQKMVVLPRQYNVNLPELPSSRQFHAGGIHLTSSIGNCDEFMALRPYRPGDPMRNIHWRSFAKTNDLIIKEFQDEYFVRHALLVDTCSTPENELVFEACISIAASYIVTMKHVESVFDLLLMGGQAHTFSWGRGLSSTEKMIEILACAESSENGTVQDLLPVLESTVHQLSSTICIFPGWGPAHQTIYGCLKTAAIPVRILVLTEHTSEMEKKIFNHAVHLREDIQVVSCQNIEQELGS